MRRLLPLLLLFLPLTTFGQSIINIPTKQCVIRSGDNAAWAAQNLDETGWLSLKQAGQKMNVLPPHYWVRCHADLNPLRALSHPALQVAGQSSAYQVFVNGKEIGGAGNMRTGAFSMDTTRQYPVPKSLIGKAPDTVALRMTTSYLGWEGLNRTIGAWFAGESDALLGRRARQIVAQSNAVLVPVLCFFVVGIAGLMLLGLYYYDRSRRELLYLSIMCISLAALRVNTYCTAASFNYPSYLSGLVVLLANLAVSVTDILFFFTMARRKVPRLYWVALAFIWTSFSFPVGSLFLPPDSAYFIAQLTSTPWITFLGAIGLIFFSTVPFVAFWPWKRIQRPMRPVAALCMVWGAAQSLWFAVRFLPYAQLGLPNYSVLWRGGLLEIRAIALTFVLLSLLALLFRDQRLVTEERAVLAGEMQAARDIQHMLVPSELESLPDLQIEVAFYPMREVGGDFYFCRVLETGCQRLLLGDVSGTGAAAAQTAAVLIGAAESQGGHSPSELLRHLNRVFRKSRLGGFATCLCADIAPDGTVTVANAGHLSPYYRGEEVAVPSSLPIGMNPEDAESYRQVTFTIEPGEQVTILSDGVVEARGPGGELFGFDRMREVSGESANEIAAAAQAFGQEDDITVLSLTFAPVVVSTA